MKLRPDRLRAVVIVLAAVLVALAVFEREWAIYILLGLLAVLILVAVVRWVMETDDGTRRPDGG